MSFWRVFFSWCCDALTRCKCFQRFWCFSEVAVIPDGQVWFPRSSFVFWRSPEFFFDAQNFLKLLWCPMMFRWCPMMFDDARWCFDDALCFRLFLKMPEFFLMPWCRPDVLSIVQFFLMILWCLDAFDGPLSSLIFFGGFADLCWSLNLPRRFLFEVRGAGQKSQSEVSAIQGQDRFVGFGGAGRLRWSCKFTDVKIFFAFANVLKKINCFFWLDVANKWSQMLLNLFVM